MKTIFILVSVLVVLFIATPNKIEAQSPEFVKCLGSGRDFRAGGIKIVSMKLKRKGDYPQIAAPRTPNERKFNTFVRKLITNNFSGYGVSYATPEFVSLNLYEEFCGASCHVGITPVNFDLKAGKQINNLAQLFKPGANFLKEIASYSIGEFRRCERSEELDIQDDWFKEGTKPTKKNYDTWGLTRDGLAITFVEYQIAPGVFPGATVIVPYSHLKGMLREDVEWFRRLNQ